MRLSSLKTYLRHPMQLLVRVGKNSFLRRMSDEQYLKMIFRDRMGYPLDLENPKTFNEKLQWLKLHDRKPEYSRMVDKYEAKKYVAERIGEEYIIPTLGVWDSFEEIDFDRLPQQFVLKCTHDSGGLVICRDKAKLNMKKARKKIERSLKQNYYWSSREWPYKNVKPRVLVEEYMEDPGSKALPVYKFFCFDGVPKIIQSIQNDKQENETIDYFDTQWNRLELRQNFPNSENPLPRPEKLEEMVALAGELAKDKMGFIRVDLYNIGGALYFSEYTFFTDSGMAKFHPETWDKTLGDWVTLPNEE